MTIEEHIENLKAIASDMPSDKCSDWIESLMAGVKALEQQSCEDCVSREYVIKLLENTKRTRKEITNRIYEVPSVKPQLKMGRWISNAEDDLKISEYTCSNCKGLSDEDTDFCPKCGSYNGGVGCR